jgi:anaerobic selenocysteine-containing dehydrogenase
MIYDEKDPFNDADRYDVLMNEADGSRHDIKEGDAIVVYNKYGTFNGRAKFVAIKSGNIEVHFPEGNALIPMGVYEQFAGIPEYQAVAIVEKAETFYAQKDKKYVEKRVEELEMEMS